MSRTNELILGELRIIASICNINSFNEEDSDFTNLEKDLGLIEAHCKAIRGLLTIKAIEKALGR